MSTLMIQRVGEPHQLELPARKSPEAAGYDLATRTTVTLLPGARQVLPTGFAWEIPEGYAGFIRDRSGLALKQGLHVLAGVIDADYRGEVGVVLINLGQEPVTLTAGDRVAQMVIAEVPFFQLVEAPQLSATLRGAGGYGSTGVGRMLQ